MNNAELELIDNLVTLTADIEPSQRDSQVVRQIRQILSRQQPQFVFVNKFGTHFPYTQSYPEAESVFQPAMQAFEAIADRERLVNSYKNAIRYSVDRFFEDLLTDMDLSDSVLIYTSDHGQNLLDDGRPTTHCRRNRVTLNEAVVPLLVFTANRPLLQKFEQAAKRNNNAASHFEIFPTILQLFGYDVEIVKRRYHQGLFEKIDKPLGFTSGPIMGRFDRQVIWHSREGLDSLER